ncbi:MAG: TetR/AcrR family transcriptional regulator [Myxococcota bacterium]
MSQATPQAVPARSERAERKRQRILDAAAQRFSASGFSKATVEEIAAAAGVSKALVYHHFRGKEAIFEELLGRTLSEWAQVGRIDEHLPPNGSIREALAGMVRASLRYAQDNPLVRSLFQLDPTVVQFVGSSATVRRHVEEGRARLVDAVERGIASGELRDDLDASRVADAARMLMMALIDQLLNPEWLHTGDEAFVDTCLEILFHGITPRNA